MTRWLYWTIHPRGGRIAVTKETQLRVYGTGPKGPTHRPRRECRGRFQSAEACIEAMERREATRRSYRERREAISIEKQRMRREEIRALIQATGGPP